MAGREAFLIPTDGDRRRRLERMNISQLLRVPYQGFIAQLVAGLLARGFAGVRPVHATVFQVLGPRGARITTLAARAQVTKQWIALLVDDLERLGYVERTADPTDKRAKLVRLTARGRALAAAADAIIAELETVWTAHVGERRFHQLRRTLVDLGLITPTPTDTTRST